MISHKYKFICPRIGKNASSTLVSYFFKFDHTMIEEGHEAILDTGFESFLKGRHRTPILKNINTDEYYKFAFVRNPYYRMVSCFYEFKNPSSFVTIKKQIQNELCNLHLVYESFDIFIEAAMRYPHIHWTPQRDMLYDGDVCLVDYVGRFETLKEDINVICKKLGIDNELCPLPVIRKAQNRDKYSVYYSKDTEDKVANMFAADLKEYGYKFK